MSPGPFILVKIISREPIEVGSRVLTIREFAPQRYGAGSGRLLEYIGDLITEYAKER